MRYLAGAFLLCVHMTAAAAGEAPRGPNCQLSVPPADAGEEFNHGITLRIYPRAKDINSRYSGCQVLLMPDGTGWAVVSMTEVVSGDPVRVWSPDKSDPALLKCRFRKGKVVEGDPQSCPSPKFLILRSMAPGCVQVVQDAVAKGGLGAPSLPNCEYE